MSELVSVAPTALDDDEPSEGVAIIGMAGRFPGAGDLASFWRNLRDGVESISALTEEELLAAGADPEILAHPRYVKARGMLPGIDLFDAAFFGFSPREAAITDPQHRVFLECAWEALEEAGVDAESHAGRIGVYAGSSLSSYLLFQMLADPPPALDEIWHMALANDKDTLASRVSYKLNLRGPSLAVQTACSTSLVAVHLARQSLLDYECDLALAGGVSIRCPQAIGYLYEEDGILSPDGHCRSFDAKACGTVFSSGAGIVVLKRLGEALADGDRVRAVLKGSAINNDGSLKVGFTAPSVEGQAEVIARAFNLADVDPETVGYIEAHGTATPLGDPIEIAALTRAFRARTERRAFCALGSVKSNIGHLDSAAGVAGLIKAVLALEHRQIPPSLHFERPNPQIDFASSPFYVNDQLRSWEAGDTPRRAGVSSFGIGGTNAHVVVEEAPQEGPPTGRSHPWQLLVLSAKTETALTSATARLADHLLREPDRDLADVAYTLAVRRQALPWRQALVAGGREEAIAGLTDGGLLVRAKKLERTPAVAFLFPGQGGQRAGMGRDLYRTEPLFRQEMDRAAEILRPQLGEDLRDLLSLTAASGQTAYWLERTAYIQPALVAVEAALARLWISWGVHPEAMFGQSLGEYLAAHVAGVMSLEDTLTLVAFRGRLTEQIPVGAMLALPLSESDVVPLLGTELSLAVVNGPFQCVVSGPEGAVETLRMELATRGVEGQRLAVSYASHSREMEPLIEPFTQRVRQVSLQPPRIPYVSSVTGHWVKDEEATDPAYWGEHLRRTVRSSDAIACLLAEPDRVLLEVAPGHGMTRLVRRHCELRGDPSRVVVAALPGDAPEPSETASLLMALGRLWAVGAPVDWAAFHAGERHRHVSLPTYPFERQRHWIEPARRRSRGDAGRPPATTAAANSVGLPVAPAAEIRETGDSMAESAGDAHDPILHRIVAIWREVLGVREVRREDCFFDLGGDSLSALQVMARLRDAFPVDLPVRLLLERPTPAHLRDAVEAALILRIEELPEEEAQRLAAGYLC